MTNIELLAPAGNEESFKAAVNAGADAVYMGLGKHNARVMAKNFTLSSYIDCINYAHIRGVKVYLTLNTLVFDDEIEEALKLLAKLYEVGVDAVLVQDLGLASLIHELFPNLELHASTQMSVYSLEQVEYLKKLGFKRVVLGRELSIDEIKYITDNTDVEIEVFSHGALCVSLSGQCLMSLAIGTRSANRGACAQPCRMRYSLYKENGEKIVPKTYIMSKKDIFTLDMLDKLIDTNVASLKIEGRNKTPEYVALVVSTYRKYIDKYLKEKSLKVDESDIKDLTQMFNRNGKSHGYFDGVQYKDSITTLSPKNTGLYLGEVIEKKGKFVKVKLEEDIDLHDGIEIYSKGNVSSTIVTCIMDSKKKIVNGIVKAGNIVYLGDVKETKIEVKDKVYKTSRYKLNLDMQNNILNKNLRQRNLVLNVDVKENCPITLSTIINNQMYTYNTNIIPQIAQTKDLTIDAIYDVFQKTQDKGIRFEKVVGYVQKGLFLKVSELNEIRRNFVEKVEEKLLTHNDIKDIEKNIAKKLNEQIKSTNSKQIAKNVLSVYNYNQQKDYVSDYKKQYSKSLERIDFQVKDYMKYEKDIFHKYSKYNLGINIPSFTLDKLDLYIKNNIERLLKMGVKTIVLGSFRYYELLKELKNKYDFTLVADYSFNVSNTHAALFIKSLGFDVVSPAFDAQEAQIDKISKVLPVERIDDYITIMTSRYCILGSFVANRKVGEKCSCPCLKDNYYLEDKFAQKYSIVCSNEDCIMRIVKENRLANRSEKTNSYIRNNIL